MVFERERISRWLPPIPCPICGTGTELMTPRQAAALVQTTVPTIRRWLARGQAHGIRTQGRRHRVCRNSLFLIRPEAVSPLCEAGSTFDSVN